MQFWGATYVIGETSKWANAHPEWANARYGWEKAIVLETVVSESAVLINMRRQALHGTREDFLALELIKFACIIHSCILHLRI